MKRRRTVFYVILFLCMAVTIRAEEKVTVKTEDTGMAPITKVEREFVIGLIAPTTRPGLYDVFISVGRRDGTPQIALPLKEDDGQLRYRLGTLTLIDRRTANH